jgi:hypothetical protein
MNKNYYIYKTTNLINNMIYVGQRRCKCLPEKDNSYLGSGVKFYEAFLEFGKKNFLKEILEICTLVELNDREKYWVKFYNSNNTEIRYNLTSGGVNGFICSEETIQKKRENNIRFFSVPENRQKRSKSLLKFFSENPEVKNENSDRKKRKTQKFGKLRVKLLKNSGLRLKIVKYKVKSQKST